MATKSAPTITLTTSQAERLFDLYNNVFAADSHYKRCQSDQFRVHVQSVYKHDGVREAFESLRAKIDAAEAVPEPEVTQKAVEAPRTGVLGN